MSKNIELLERQLNDYARLFNEADVAITIVDQSGNFIDCNKAYCSLLGFTEKPISGQFHPNDISPKMQPDGCSSSDKARSMIQLAVQKGQCSFE